jgi:pimeloyl-ACP methyl ester carboxylesterase
VKLEKGTTIGMNVATSRDGTAIAYDKTGSGPAVILVAGALCARLSWSGPKLATLLAPHFTVINYDRRGRGDSGDTKPYSVDREIEDIDAVLDRAGGSAYLYGHSSGAVLGMEAALSLGGDRVGKLAMYEPACNDAADARQAWSRYTEQLQEYLSGDRRGDAVALFMRSTGVPNSEIDGLRRAPAWPALEALAPTLAYDHVHILGRDASVPTARAAQVTVPALVMSGGASYPFMHDTARTLSRAMPSAELRTLEGQTHAPDVEVLAEVLVEFFSR